MILLIDAMEQARLMCVSQRWPLKSGPPQPPDEDQTGGAPCGACKRRLNTTSRSQLEVTIHHTSQSQSPSPSESKSIQVRHRQQQQKSRSQTLSTTTTTRPTSSQTLLAWHRKQVIAGHALLCLIILFSPSIATSVDSQNVTLTTTTATTAATSAPEIASTATATATTTTTPATSDAINASSLAPLEASLELSQQSPSSTSGNKLKPINFTLVDEMFASILNDDDELIKRWRNMDAQFQEGIRSILKLVFPQIVAVSQDAKVSGDCSGGILKWILSLRNLRSWAIKMLDATGKPTAGIFEGSLTMFGNHRQCLSVRAPDEDEIEISDQFEEYFRGQFCVLHLRPWLGKKKRFYNLNSTVEPLIRKNYKYYEKTLYDELAEIAIAFNFIDIRMDLCVPSTCSMADIQRVADLFSKKLEMRAKVMRCDIEPASSSASSSSFWSSNLKDTIYETITTYWLLVPLGSIVLTLLSTLVVLFVNAVPTQRQHNWSARAKLTLLLYNLSLQGAASSLFNCSPTPTPTPTQRRRGSPNNSRALPLYGLRNVFIVWFVIVQLTVELNYQYLRESLVLRNMMLTYWPLQILINTSMIFESLILITAFTYSYCNLESSARHLIAYIGRKYFRLMPSIVTVIMLTIITPLTGLSSPVWKNFVDRQSQVCKLTGHLDLLFLQNFIAYDKICLPHTWLFCVEFQLILLTIPLILMLNKTFTHNEDLIIIGRTKLDNLNNNGAGDDGKLSNSTCEHAAGGAIGQDEDNRSQVTRRSQSKTTTTTPPTQFRATLVHLICKSKAGPIGLALLIGGALINFSLVYTNQLPPTWFHTFPDPDQKSYYFGKYLTKAWTHLTTFIIGLYAGYLCRASIQLMALAPAPASIASGQSLSCGACGCNGQAPSRQRQQQQQQQQPQQRDGECIVQVFKNGPKAAQMAQQNGLECSNKLSEDTSCYDNGSGASSRTVTCTNLPPLVAQLAALTCLLSIIFCTFSWSTSELPTPLVSALYDSLSRLIWSLALAGLMIKLCTPSSSTSSSGACGGQPLADYKYSRLSSVFSHPLCLLLGRLSFLAYLVAPYVHTLVLGLQEQSLFPSLYLIFHVSLGNIVITYALALILSLLIEQPIKLVVEQLCNCCLGGGGGGGGLGEASGADDSEGSEDITSVSNSASTLATSPTQTPTTAISVASLATSAS